MSSQRLLQEVGRRPVANNRVSCITWRFFKTAGFGWLQCLHRVGILMQLYMSSSVCLQIVYVIIFGELRKTGERDNEKDKALFECFYMCVLLDTRGYTINTHMGFHRRKTFLPGYSIVFTQLSRSERYYRFSYEYLSVNHNLVKKLCTLCVLTWRPFVCTHRTFICVGEKVASPLCSQR